MKLNPFYKNILKYSFISGIWVFLILSELSAQDLSNLNPQSGWYRDSLTLPEVSNKKLKSFSGNSLLDSVYLFEWIRGTDIWQQTQSGLYKYNAENLPSEKLSRIWISLEERWKEISKVETSYNLQNKKNEEITKVWNAVNEYWINRAKNTYSYDSVNKLKHYINAYWNAENQLWNDTVKYSYSFDNEGNWIFYLKETWIADSLSWGKNYRFLFNYEYGNRVELLRQNYHTDSMSWINSNKILYSYDAQNRLTTETGEVWDADSAKWDNNSIIQYFYDNVSNLEEKIYHQVWGQQGWIYAARYTYTYNAQGKNNFITYFTWDKETIKWIENAAYQYDYNEDGELIREIWLVFNLQDMLWENEIKFNYYLSNPLGRDELEEQKLSIFPNPFRNKLSITFNDRFNPKDKIWIQILDLNGRVFYKTLLTNQETKLFELDLQPGIYILKVQQGNRIFYKKIISN